MNIFLDALIITSCLILAAIVLTAVGYAIKWYVKGFALRWKSNPTLMRIYLGITALALMNSAAAAWLPLNSTDANFAFGFIIIFGAISGFASLRICLDGVS